MLNQDKGTKAYRILALDDNESVLLIVAQALRQEGFEVLTAKTAEEGLTVIRNCGLPHLAIVDINMPGMGGMEFCETVQEYSDLPVIILTAVDEEETVVQAIEHYAEDYVTKPFRTGELVARVRRVLRRLGDFAYTLESLTKVDHHLEVDFSSCQARLDGTDISLTPTETKLLYILMRNAGKVTTTDFLLRRLWPRELAYEDRLRVYVHRLRRKIEPKPDYKYIVSERGIGYSFKAQ